MAIGRGAILGTLAAVLVAGPVVGPTVGLAGPASPPLSPALDMALHGDAPGVDLKSPTLDTLGLGPARAPSGGGTSRAPSPTTELGRGVYLTVSPSCIPGVDEPLFPARRPAPRR